MFRLVWNEHKITIIKNQIHILTSKISTEYIVGYNKYLIILSTMQVISLPNWKNVAAPRNRTNEISCKRTWIDLQLR